VLIPSASAPPNVCVLFCSYTPAYTHHLCKVVTPCLPHASVVPPTYRSVCVCVRVCVCVNIYLYAPNHAPPVQGRDPLFAPCTPLGCIALLDRCGIEIKGKRAVVVGGICLFPQWNVDVRVFQFRVRSEVRVLELSCTYLNPCSQENELNNSGNCG